LEAAFFYFAAAIGFANTRRAAALLRPGGRQYAPRFCLQMGANTPKNAVVAPQAKRG